MNSESSEPEIEAPIETPKDPVQDLQSKKNALKLEEQREMQGRKSLFVQELKILLVKHNCAIVGIPKYTATEMGWMTLVEIDAIAKPR